MQTADSAAYEKFVAHVDIAIEDAHHIKAWGDGNCGSMIAYLVESLKKKGLYAEPEKSSQGYRKKQIGNVLRTSILERDAYRCKACGGWKDLCVDHIIPESKGGSLDHENLQTLCRSCNSKKGAR